ncbi:hypothetical protein [Brucella pituitosa]|uniref:Uncharacterized protein n=1 Tax=Brucella pituitosa TaxID=571256 RepID=A0ABS3K3U4_9HYPH|nr:hypothetical protein [Brucella pituitosa]MBO1040461.1 hypothetical protein [Brucella pituitosa]
MANECEYCINGLQADGETPCPQCSRSGTLTNEGTTRPAAPVEGLGTKAYVWKTKDAPWRFEEPFFRSVDQWRASDDQFDHEDLCLKSQAEAIIAAKVEQERLRFEGDLDKWMKIIGAGITGYQPEAYALMDLACQELVNLRADNAALTARVKEWQEESERKSEDWFDFCKAIGIEIDTHEAVADAINTARSNDGNEFKALENQLAASRNVLSVFLSEYDALYLFCDEPPSMVSAVEAARAALEGRQALKGGSG